MATASGFNWSATSFFVGVSATIDLSTIISSLLLWRRNAHSRFYAWLAAVATAHMIDLVSRSVSDVLTRTDAVGPDGMFVYRPLTPGTLAINLVCVTFAWIGAVGFVTLNATRFFVVASSRMPRAAKAIIILTGVSVILNSINNVVYYISFVGTYRKGNTSSSETLLEAMDHFFSAWSIYDAIVNCVISIAFITFLQSLGGNGSGLRKGFSEMLSSVTWLLGIECALMISANLLVQIAPTLDPAWMSIYICESLRLRIFCMFLQTLNRMLRQKVVTELPSSASPDQFLPSATSQHHDRSYAAIAMPQSAAGGFSSSLRSTTWQGSSTGTTSSHLDDVLPL